MDSSKKLFQRGGSSLVRLRRTMRNGVSSRRRSLRSIRSSSTTGNGRVMKVVGGGGSRSVIRMKVRRLQRLVPGGKGLKPDRLFLQTAQYILHLRFQVNVLQTLSNLYKQP